MRNWRQERFGSRAWNWGIDYQNSNSNTHLTQQRWNMRVRCFVFVFCLRPPQTRRLESLEPSLSVALVDLCDVLARPSGLDDNNNHFHLHGSVSLLICLLPPPSSPSLSLVCAIFPIFSLHLCLAAVFKWIPLQKLVSERSSAASTDPPRLLIFRLFVALFFCLSLVFIRSAVPLAQPWQRHRAHTHTHSKWHTQNPL